MRYLTADEILDGKGNSFKNRVLVLNENDEVVELALLSAFDPTRLEKFEGILCPSFINAHCHLELSHLQGRIEKKTGFLNFALSLMKQRDLPDITQREVAMKQADDLMWQNGISACGDIANNNESIATKQNAKIHYHTFIELIGFDPSKSHVILEKGKSLRLDYVNANLKASLTAHAPYSVSKELMALIRAYCEECNDPFSIHNQESEQENVFYKTGKGDYAKLYEALNLNIDYFQPDGSTSIQAYAKSYINQNTVLVHNTKMKWEDLDYLQKNNLFPWFCFCPSANLYIENALPDFQLFADCSDKLLLGTDSLASNDTLSILEEMKIIQQHHSTIELKELVKWACMNGAEFLRVSNVLGSFDQGKKPGVINISELKMGQLSTKSRVRRIV